MAITVNVTDTPVGVSVSAEGGAVSVIAATVSGVSVGVGQTAYPEPHAGTHGVGGTDPLTGSAIDAGLTTSAFYNDDDTVKTAFEAVEQVVTGGLRPYLPLATATAAGAVVVGSGLTVSGGSLSAAAHASSHAAGGADPIAISQSQVASVYGNSDLSGDLAEIILNATNASNLTDGVVSPSRLPLATATAAGAVVVGSGLTVTAGVISAGGGSVVSVNGKTGSVSLTSTDVTAAATSHTHAAGDVTSGTFASARLPLATTAVIGAVSAGSGLSVSGGTLSANVVSVAGRTGAVALTGSDIADNSGNVYLAGGLFLPANAQIALGNAASIVFNDTSEQFTAWTGTAAQSQVASYFGYADITGDLTYLESGISGLASDVSDLWGAVTGKADSYHTHDATNVVSGTFDPARLPLATATAVGAVSAGSGLSVSGGTLSANVVSVNGKTGSVSLTSTDVTAAATSHTHAAGDVTSGTFASARLPLATAAVVGAVSAGTGLSVSGGTLSANVVSVNGKTGSVSLTSTDVTAAATSHVHGNITNSGAIGTASDAIVVTSTSGVLTTATVGSGLSLSGGTLATRITISNASPTGGSDGDIWLKY